MSCAERKCCVAAICTLCCLRSKSYRIKQIFFFTTLENNFIKLQLNSHEKEISLINRMFRRCQRSKAFVCGYGIDAARTAAGLIKTAEASYGNIIVVMRRKV